MADENTEKSEQIDQNKNPVGKKRFKIRWQVLTIVPLIAIVFGIALAIISNNCSLWSNKKFSNKLDKAIEEATNWVHNNEAEILRVKNIALIKMLQECNIIYPAGNLGTICDKFMAAPSRPAPRAISSRTRRASWAPSGPRT